MSGVLLGHHAMTGAVGVSTDHDRADVHRPESSVGTHPLQVVDRGVPAWLARADRMQQMTRNMKCNRNTRSQSYSSPISSALSHLVKDISRRLARYTIAGLGRVGHIKRTRSPGVRNIVWVRWPDAPAGSRTTLGRTHLRATLKCLGGTQHQRPARLADHQRRIYRGRGLSCNGELWTRINVLTNDRPPPCRSSSERPWFVV